MSAAVSLWTRALPVDGRGLDEHVLQLAAIAAGIHAQRAADGAGHAAQEFETGDPGIGRGARHGGIERGRAGADARALDRDLAEGGRQTDHHARNAAIAHQKIGAHADDADAQIGGPGIKEGRQILGIGRAEQNFRIPAGAEPDQILERRILGIGAADGRQRIARTGLHHAWPSRAFSAASRSAAQAVIEPAPRQTMAPPGLANCATMAARSSAPVDDLHIAMAVGPQRFRIGIAVDAGDRLLARRIDRRDDGDIGIVEAGRELLEGVAQAACSDAAGRRRRWDRNRPGARPSARRRS